MVSMYLTHIYTHLLYLTYTVVVHCLTVQLLYMYMIYSVYEYERDKRYFGGKHESGLRTAGGEVERLRR